MQKFLFLAILSTVPIICFAQNSDCDFSQETIDYIDKGMKYDSMSNVNYSKVYYKIKAINYFYEAKENNPRCEIILHQLSVWLVECGLLEKDLEHYANAIEDFDYSIEVSNELLSFTTDENIRQEILLLISQATTYRTQMLKLQEKKQEVEIKRDAAIRMKEKAKRDIKNTSTFITIGTGLGMSYVTVGANVSIYMHPNGMILTGAIGYTGGWNAGIGYSLGVRKYNGHVKFLYGHDDTKQPIGYMGIGGNFDIIGDHIGLNADVGLGGELDSFSGEPSFLGSVGIYVKF